jgi:hypothetical protein
MAGHCQGEATKARDEKHIIAPIRSHASEEQSLRKAMRSQSDKTRELRFPSPGHGESNFSIRRGEKSHLLGNDRLTSDAATSNTPIGHRKQIGTLNNHSPIESLENMITRMLIEIKPLMRTKGPGRVFGDL